MLTHGCSFSDNHPCVNTHGSPGYLFIMLYLNIGYVSVCGLAFAPDCRSLVVADRHGESGEWSLPDGQLIRKLPAVNRVSYLRFRADGHLAFTGGLVNWDTGKPWTSEVVSEPRRTMAITAISEDGLWMTSANHPVVPPRPTRAGRPRPQRVPAGTPGSLSLYQLDTSGWVEPIWEVPSFHFRMPYGYICRADVSSTAEHVVVMTGEKGALTLHDGASGHSLGNFAAVDDHIVHVRFTSDGDHVLAFSRKHLYIWQTATPEEPPMTVVCSERDRLDSMALHPDSRRVFLTIFSDDIAIVDIASGSLMRTMAWGVPMLASVAISPDGMLAAAANHGGEIVVWDVDT